MASEAAAVLLPAESAAEASSSIFRAASVLQQDGLVAFPTETVYGLGANALSEGAVRKIYHAKGRPSDNPLIVHVASEAMAHELLPEGQASVPELYKPLMKRFWPGPLSLIFPLTSSSSTSTPKRTLAKSVTAGQPSVAIRMPFHPLAISLIAAADLPLAAPSANLSSRPSPTTAQHVLHDLGVGRGLEAVLDGGPCNVGLESTVVDIDDSGDRIRVLRAGGISAADIEECLREAGFAARPVQVYAKDFRSAELEAKPTTPGMKYKHYAPHKARAVLLEQSHDARTLVGLLDDAAMAGKQVALMLTDELLHSLAYERLLPSPPQASSSSSSSSSMYRLTEPHPPVLVHSLGPDAVSAAQALFAGLRTLDDLDVDEIWIERIDDESGVGLAVNERMSKAAAGRTLACSY